METKHLSAEIKASKDAGSGSFEAILSMPTVDRDGEVIDPGAFHPLPKKITIDVDHGLSAEKTIGSGTPFYDGDVLKVRGTFASTPLAQQIRTLVLEEHLGHMSVAYRAAEYENDEKDGLPHLRKGELVNAAIVGIPANREAAILVAKDAVIKDNIVVNSDGPAKKTLTPDDIASYAKVGARNAAKDLERLQATHDHMVELGAQCTMKHAHNLEPKFYDGPVDVSSTSGVWTTHALVGTSKSTGQTLIFDMRGNELGRSVETKSSDEDPDVKAAAPAAAESPAPTLMADAYVALAKARMLMLDN